MKKSNGAALIPIYVFLVLYLGLGILFEYVLKIPMGFYNIPIVVAFMVAIFVACLQNRKVSFDEKLQIMANGLTDKNIITMLLIFLTAGIFVGVVGRSSAESVAYFMLSIIPARFSVAVLFVVACFVSTAMGTSVGTITLLTPIGVAVADASGFNLPLCVASIMGGAMFGDNLSFISDTTIAACNGQGCAMKDKFRANFWIAFPAAIVTLIVILVKSFNTEIGGVVQHDYNMIQIIPYVLVLIGGIAGVNVFVVLIVGIVSGSIIMLATGQTAAVDLLTNMGSGAAGLLVGAMDIATANNTVAIVMANPIAKEMADDYGISPKRSASLLDTFSCIFQGIIPYGAQMLVAISAVSELGHEISAFQIIPNLFYPILLLVSSLVWMLIRSKDKTHLAKRR